MARSVAPCRCRRAPRAPGTVVRRQQEPSTPHTRTVCVDTKRPVRRVQARPAPRATAACAGAERTWVGCNRALRHVQARPAPRATSVRATYKRGPRRVQPRSASTQGVLGADAGRPVRRRGASLVPTLGVLCADAGRPSRGEQAWPAPAPSTLAPRTRPCPARRRILLHVRGPRPARNRVLWHVQPAAYGQLSKRTATAPWTRARGRE
jgi:hypothetical protein